MSGNYVTMVSPIYQSLVFGLKSQQRAMEKVGMRKHNGEPLMLVPLDRLQTNANQCQQAGQINLSAAPPPGTSTPTLPTP